MSAPPIPRNEDLRVAALRAYDILDTAEEDIYNAITRAAAEVCATPMASLTFVDSDRQWFKSRVGVTDRQTHRDISFCAHAINKEELFVVEDAQADERFKSYSNVTGDPHLRFYAGMPLVTPGGLALGALCVLDVVPRRLNNDQAQTLRLLAESAMRVLELRRNMGIAVFAKAVDMTSDGVTISDNQAGGPKILYANESFLRFTGYDYHEIINQPCIFPAAPGRSEVQRAFETAYINAHMTTVETEISGASGQQLWDRISFVPYTDETSALLYVVAIHRDITAQKEAERQTQQLQAMRTTLATLDHVVKNFMNAAHLYSLKVSAGEAVSAEMQQAFEAALIKTRQQLTAIHQMPSFKERATPFGFRMLDLEQRGKDADEGS